jgi:hypothetical protein
MERQSHRAKYEGLALIKDQASQADQSSEQLRDKRLEAESSAQSGYSFSQSFYDTFLYEKRRWILA